MNAQKRQQKYSVKALAAKRGEVSGHNLSGVSKQMFLQMSEETLRDISLGKITEIIELFPLEVKKPVVKKQSVQKPIEKKKEFHKPIEKKKEYVKPTAKEFKDVSKK
jgi:hypothetical protein